MPSLVDLKNAVADALAGEVFAPLVIQSPIDRGQLSFTPAKDVPSDEALAGVMVGETSSEAMTRGASAARAQQKTTRIDVTLSRRIERTEVSQQDSVLNLADQVANFLAGKRLLAEGNYSGFLPITVDVSFTIVPSDLEGASIMVCQVQAFYSHT